VAVQLFLPVPWVGLLDVVSVWVLTSVVPDPVSVVAPNLVADPDVLLSLLALVKTLFAGEALAVALVVGGECYQQGLRVFVQI